MILQVCFAWKLQQMTHQYARQQQIVMIIVIHLLMLLCAKMDIVHVIRDYRCSYSSKMSDKYVLNSSKTNIFLKIQYKYCNNFEEFEQHKLRI